MSESDSSSSCEESTCAALVRGRVLQLLSELPPARQREVERWFNSPQYTSELRALQRLRREERQLSRVAARLRSRLGPAATVASEHIAFPREGDLADCTAANTLHVDEFLCSNRRLDRLVERGDLSRHHCLQCGSRDVRELTIISHSAGRSYLIQIFKYLLPKDLSGQQILDVGSRLGAILYGAYYMTNISKIIGVEMNMELCKLQRDCIAEMKMEPSRISVEHADVTSRRDLVRASHVLVVNVVDCFVQPDKQVHMWRVFKEALRRGALVVMMRSAQDTLSSLGVAEEFSEWLDVVRPAQMHNEIFLNVDDADYTNVYLYRVK